MPSILLLGINITADDFGYLVKKTNVQGTTYA